MVEIRRLHPSEFDLLKEVEDGFVPNPEASIALVAENSSRIVGRVFMVSVSHAEGIFIEPAYRGGTLFKRMMDTLEIEARAEGITKMLAFSVKPEISHYIERRCGYQRLPWTVLAKELV
jgi:hypothetical protein